MRDHQAVIREGHMSLPWHQWWIPWPVLFAVPFALWWAQTGELLPAAASAAGSVLVILGLPTVAFYSWRWRLTPAMIETGRLRWPALGGKARMRLGSVTHVDVYLGPGKGLLEQVQMRPGEGQLKRFHRGVVVIGINPFGSNPDWPRMVIGTRTADEAIDLGQAVADAARAAGAIVTGARVSTVSESGRVLDPANGAATQDIAQDATQDNAGDSAGGGARPR